MLVNKKHIAWFLLAGLVLMTIGYYEGRKYLADVQVRELCAVDGGIKVYETVTLPAEKFDRFGNFKIPMKKDAKASDEYYYEWDLRYLKPGNAEILRSEHRVVRVSDRKILGESIRYIRRGGDFPSPMHESSYICPEINSQVSAEKSIFQMKSEK